MATIRRATLADGAGVLHIAHRFMSNSVYATVMSFNADKMADVIALIFSLPEDKACIFVALEEDRIVGFIAGIGGPASNGDLWVEEMAWYVDSDHRSGRLGYKLWGCLKDWGRQNGYLMLKMVAPHASPVAGFYERAGGIPLETSYVFRL